MAAFLEPDYFTFFSLALSGGVSLVSSDTGWLPEGRRPLFALLQLVALAVAVGVYLSIAVAAFTYSPERIDKKIIQDAVLLNLLAHSLPLVGGLALLTDAKGFAFPSPLTTTLGGALLSACVLAPYVLLVNYREVYGAGGITIDARALAAYYLGALFGAWRGSLGLLG